MTNAEKFLKDGVSPKAMWYEFKKWYNDTHCTCAYGEAIEIFMVDMAKPILSEVEKVILRNVDKRYVCIKRDWDNDLILVTCSGASGYILAFNHLFQFIEDGEEYKISDLLGE